MTEREGRTPNPRRVAAGRLNALKRKPLAPEGREKLRQACLAHRPWEHATGPRSPEGKARVALNGKARQKGPRSVREIKAELKELWSFIAEMRDSQNVALGMIRGLG